MRKMKAAELILDFDLYPRNNVDSHNVRALSDVISEGGELPPVIADKKSKRVVDGVHRVKATIKVFGADAEIAVIEKVYKTEADMFLDAIRYNASHGAKLDTCDRTHCLIVAERLGIPADSVAGVLHIPIVKATRLLSGRTARMGNLTVPLKRTIQHKAGMKLTKRQQEANENLSGMRQVFYVNQLIELIESELIDLSDERLVERLIKLRELLDGVPSVV